MTALGERCFTSPIAFLEFCVKSIMHFSVFTLILHEESDLLIIGAIFENTYQERHVYFACYQK